jgi:hypothetical protein
MTRKDYVKLAGALKAERPGENWDANKRVQWDQDVKAIVCVLLSDNPRFDQNKFVAACGGFFEV